AGGWRGWEGVGGSLSSGFRGWTIGCGNVDGPLAGWAPLLGVHGMALLAAFAAASVAALRLPPTVPPRFTVPMLATALALAATGELLFRVQWSSTYGKPLNVRLVQGNIEQSQKFDLALLDNGILTHLRLAAQPYGSDEPPPDLIVL